MTRSWGRRRDLPTADAHNGCPQRMPTADEIAALLRGVRTIAVVGCSPDPSRDSHRVSSYLKRAGYRVIPVNPNCLEILGETCYPSLLQIPVPVDLVDVFRRSSEVAPVVEEAIAAGARAIWTQLGVRDEKAARRAREAGLVVVMDRCLMVDHAALVGS